MTRREEIAIEMDELRTKLKTLIKEADSLDEELEEDEDWDDNDNMYTPRVDYVASLTARQAAYHKR